MPRPSCGLDLFSSPALFAGEVEHRLLNWGGDGTTR
jgi:hypothetical protein